MKYRLKIAMSEQNELEKLPLQVALKVEKHLARMAELAAETAPADPIWSKQRDPDCGFLRFDLEGFCVLYQVDRAKESVVVSSIKRLAGRNALPHPADDPPPHG